MTQGRTFLQIATYGIRWSILPSVVVWVILMLSVSSSFSPAALLAILFAIFLGCGVLLGVMREISKRREEKRAG